MLSDARSRRAPHGEHEARTAGLQDVLGGIARAVSGPRYADVMPNRSSSSAPVLGVAHDEAHVVLRSTGKRIGAQIVVDSTNRSIGRGVAARAGRRSWCLPASRRDAARRRCRQRAPLGTGRQRELSTEALYQYVRCGSDSAIHSAYGHWMSWTRLVSLLTAEPRHRSARSVAPVRVARGTVQAGWIA